jgi:hypothetical protein
VTNPKIRNLLQHLLLVKVMLPKNLRAESSLWLLPSPEIATGAIEVVTVVGMTGQLSLTGEQSAIETAAQFGIQTEIVILARAEIKAVMEDRI